MSLLAAWPFGRTVDSIANRRRRSPSQWLWVLGLLGTITAGVGCQSWTHRKKEDAFEKENRRIKELMSDPDRPRLVGEIASALGMTARRYDAMALISNLPGTGGTVKPSAQREMILKEMRLREVPNPQFVLDSPATAMAKVRVYANPCDTKGDTLDILVECSSECNATDLRDGYLMPTKLREYMFLDRARESNDKADASGEVVVLPQSVMGDTEPNLLRGVVIGGGRLMETPALSIRVENNYQHVTVVSAIEKAINKRFFYQDANKQLTVAKGKNDWQIEIVTLPKYRWDPMHYMSTLLATGFGETDSQVAERIVGCRTLLMRRETARRAACELEAIGNAPAADVLLEGLGSSDTEIRFYAAYSLAYLDRPECVPVLQSLAISEPAFRPLCLIGLAINEHASARDALNELLQEAEPELRYGAILALRQRNPRDPAVMGDAIGEFCNLIQIPSKTPLIAVSLEQKKEVVLFGSNATIDLREELSPTPSTRLTPLASGMIRIAKRQVNGEVLQNIIASDLQSLLKALPTIDANYSDVVHTLDRLNQDGYLSIPVAFNPRPRAGRVYEREENVIEEATEIDRSITVDGASRKSGSTKLSWLPEMSWPSFGSSNTSDTKVLTTEMREVEGNR